MRYNRKKLILTSRIVLILACIAVIVFAMPRENPSKFAYQLGDPWRHDDLRAAMEFPVKKDSADIRAEEESIEKQFIPYCHVNENTDSSEIARFKADCLEGSEPLPETLVSHVSSLMREAYRIGIVSDSLMAKAADSTLVLHRIDGNTVTKVSVTDYISAKSAYNNILEDPSVKLYSQQLEERHLQDYIHPNVVLDEQKNRTELAEQKSSVARFKSVIAKDSLIVAQGKKITQEIYTNLLSYEDALKLSKREVEVKGPFTLLGQILYVTIMLGLVVVYILLFRRDYMEKPRVLDLMFLSIVLYSVATSLFMRHTFLNVYYIPYAMLPLFIRVFMDSRSAFMSHIMMVLICALAVKFQYDFIVLQVVAGAVAIYSMRRLTKRSELFVAALLITCVTAIAYIALQLMQDKSLAEIDIHILNAILINGVVLLFTYPAMYLIEKLFGFTSDVTLIELSNTSNKLLRRLSMEAPGTYQHSIMVSNIAAEIAENIGAQPQLVRTGALYHDIGKMVCPENFVENQRSGMNPLIAKDRKEAASIVLSHVVEGIKLAEKEGLPEEIIDFIRTHHGKGQTKYFLINYQNEHPDEEIDLRDFSYRGPNPQTKEQAILMMTDAVEAASRSLPEYTEDAIRTLIDKIIDGQVQDRLFTECPINFRDISEAKAVLMDKLMAIYHTRIAYPKEEQKEA